jgi:hypothetical protein
MTVAMGWVLGVILLGAEPTTMNTVSSPDVINIRELQIDIALGRARARTLSRARRDAFGRLLLMRRNFRSRALQELSVDRYDLSE